MAQKYRLRIVDMEATRWFKSGDHPDDDREGFTDPDTGEDFFGEGKVVRYFRHPYVSGDLVCPLCGYTMHEHGWIDQPGSTSPTVCPGDYIVTLPSGEYSPINPVLFEEMYEPIAESSADTLGA